MKIVFKKQTTLINVPVAIAIGTSRPLTAEGCLPKNEDGELKFYEGAVPAKTRTERKLKVPADSMLEIYPNYSYDSKTNILTFRACQAIGDSYKFCVADYIDTTVYCVENITEADFCIID